MSYLRIVQRDKKHYGIWNKKDNIYLGALEYMRVGAFMSWCLTDVPSPDIFFSASCQDEIRQCTKELNKLSLDNKGEKVSRQ